MKQTGRTDDRSELIRQLAQAVQKEDGKKQEEPDYEIIQRVSGSVRHNALINKKAASSISAVDTVASYAYDNLIALLRSQRSREAERTAYQLSSIRQKVFDSLSEEEKDQLKKECQELSSRIIASGERTLAITIGYIDNWLDSLRKKTDEKPGGTV